MAEKKITPQQPTAAAASDADDGMNLTFERSNELFILPVQAHAAAFAVLVAHQYQLT